MNEISGTADSLINLGMAMSDARLKGEMSVRTLKKELAVQAENALRLIQSVPKSQPAAEPAQGSQGGSGAPQIDLMA